MRLLTRIGPLLPLNKRLAKPILILIKQTVESIQFLLSRELKKITLIQEIINDIQVA